MKNEKLREFLNAAKEFRNLSDEAVELLEAIADGKDLSTVPNDDEVVQEVREFVLAETVGDGETEQHVVQALDSLEDIDDEDDLDDEDDEDDEAPPSAHEDDDIQVG